MAPLKVPASSFHEEVLKIAFSEKKYVEEQVPSNQHMHKS